MTRRFPSSLRARLLALVLLALVPALGMILLSAAEQRRQAADHARGDALRLARLAAYQQAKLLENARELLGTLAQLRTIREDDPETCRTLLRRALDQRSHYATLFAASVPQGTVFCATLANAAPHSVAERPYFRRAVETRRFAVGDYQVNRTTGQRALVLAHPVFGDSGRLDAIVAASLELRWLNRLASELPFPPGTAVTVTDRHGTIIGRHPDADAWLGRPLSDLPAFRDRLPLGGEAAFQAVGFDGRQRLFAVAPLSTEPELAGFSVITGVPADTALAAADRALVRNLVGLGLVTALVVLTAWVASGALVLRPVARVLAATRRLGAGDLAARSGAMPGATEIDDLARAFDDMADALQQDTAARTRMAEELERRHQEAETLLTVARSVGSSLDLTETMRRVARELGRHLKADMVGAYVPTPDGSSLRALAGYHVPKPLLEAFRDYRIPLKGHPVLVEAWEQQQPVFSSDVPADLRIDREAVARFPHQSLLVVPLIHEGELLGGLGAVWWRERRALTPDEFRLADGIGRQAALTIAGARFHEETRRRLAEVTTVTRVAHAVNSTLRLEAVFQAVVDEISAAFAYRRVSIYLLEGDALRLQASVGYATTIGVIPIDRGMSGRVARSGRAELMRDATRDLEFLAAEPDIRQAVIAPLRTRGGRVLGTLAVESSGEPELTENDLGLMELLADQVAVAVANARLYDETARGQREAEAVARLARTLTETLDVTALAGQVVQEMLPLLGASFARLRLLQPDGSLRTVARADPGGVHSDSDSVLPSGAGLSARVVAEGRAAVSRDVLGEAGIALPDALRRQIEASGDRAIVAAPLRVKKAIIGVLSVADRVGREFSEREVTLLQTVADQAALALDNARLFAEADRRRRAAESLAEVGQLISQSLEPEEVALWIADGIRRLLGALAATLYRLEPESGDLVALGVANAPELEDVSGRNVVLPRGTGLSAVAIREGRAVTTRDILTDPRIVFTPEARARTERSPFRAALAVPIRGGGKASGALAVGDRAGRVFGEEDVRVAEAFADRAAVALDNARLYEAAERRRREAEVLAELARSVGASLDLDTVLQRVVEGAKELCQSDVAEIALWEPASSAMVFRYWAGVSSTAYRALRVEPGKGVGGQVILTGRPFRTDNYAGDPRITKDYVGPAGEEGVASLLSVPIRMGDRVEGLLNVANRAVVRRFTDADEAILVKLADHAAIAIGNARLYAEAERRRRMAESLAEVGRVLSQSLDFEEVAQRIVGSVRTLLGAVAAGVVRLEPESGDLVAVATSGEVGVRRGSTLVFPEGTGLVGLAVSERRPVVTADVLADPRVRLTPETRARIEQTPSRAALAVPLVVKNRVIGAFGIGDRLGRVFDAEEIRIAQACADQAAVALENARLFEEQLGLLEETTRQRAEESRLLAQVLAGRERLQTLSRRLVEVQEAERGHIARELHDEIGQALTALKLTLEMAGRPAAGADLRPDDAPVLDDARVLVDELMTRVRDLSLDLRPAMLDDLGILPALLWHLERYTARMGVRVTFRHTGVNGRFRPEVETAVYRIVQEALTNVARHSGKREATVRLWADAEVLGIEIADEGVGFDVAAAMAAGTTGGLGGMQERAVLLDGHLAVESAPGAGTRVTAELPLAPRGPGSDEKKKNDR